MDAPTGALVALGEDTSVKYVEKGTPMSIDMITSVPETRADRLPRGSLCGQGLDGNGVAVGLDRRASRACMPSVLQYRHPRRVFSILG